MRLAVIAYDFLLLLNAREKREKGRGNEILKVIITRLVGIGQIPRFHRFQTSRFRKDPRVSICAIVLTQPTTFSFRILYGRDIFFCDFGAVRRDTRAPRLSIASIPTCERLEVGPVLSLSLSLSLISWFRHTGRDKSVVSKVGGCTVKVTRFA